MSKKILTLCPKCGSQMTAWIPNLRGVWGRVCLAADCRYHERQDEEPPQEVSG